MVAMTALTDYLTYYRPVTERRNNRLYTEEIPEPCFKRSATDPFVLHCPAGFEPMLAKKFKNRYEFIVTRTRSSRVRERTQADWSLLDGLEFREGQRPILESMAVADRGRIVVPPAVGKSLLIAWYAKLMPQARIIVSTKQKSVLAQIYEYLQAELSEPVGFVCSGKNIEPNARVVCVSQGTVAKYFPHDGEQDVDVLFVDEYHEWGSQQKLEILGAVKEAKLFGLSGNNIRGDGAEFRLDGFFGPMLAEMSHAEAVKKNLVTPICVVWVPVDSYISPFKKEDGLDERQRYGIWRYAVRNRSIAEVARLFGEDDQVLISVRSIEHALFLRQFLPEFTVVHGVQNDRTSNLGMFRAMELTSGMPPMTDERLQMLKMQFSDGTLKKVIATDVWKHGVSFPHLSVVIRAEGSDSIVSDTQWPGRASRIKEGKNVSLVFDFTDEYDNRFWHKAIQRRNRYAQQQYEQITLQDLKKMMRRSPRTMNWTEKLKTS